MKAELIDSMGSDLTVVNAARVSFDKESDWEIDPELAKNIAGPMMRLKSSDVKLIQYLAKHNHWTPFSHCVVTMRETIPIFVARQRFKHMVGFTYNEVSRRYVDASPDFFYPVEWRGKPTNAKQGSSSEVITKIWIDDEYTDDIKRRYWHYIESSLELYESMIRSDVAPELARMVLPQSAYTSYYTTGSLAAWARAYKLRSKKDAQLEIRELASQWNDIISPLFPHSWSALVDDI